MKASASLVSSQREGKSTPPLGSGLEEKFDQARSLVWVMTICAHPVFKVFLPRRMGVLMQGGRQRHRAQGGASHFISATPSVQATGCTSKQ